VTPAEDTYAIRLAKKITASADTYRSMADGCRRAYDMVGDIRWRAMADGLELAREHQLTVAQAMRDEQPGGVA
jgi:hypothetical protein